MAIPTTSGKPKHSWRRCNAYPRTDSRGNCRGGGSGGGRFDRRLHRQRVHLHGRQKEVVREEVIPKHNSTKERHNDSSET